MKGAYLLVLGLFFSTTSFATIIDYESSNIAGNRWQYDYSVTNNTLTDPIDTFAIYFTYGQYSNLTLETSPANWDSIVINPDPNLFVPDDGFLDAYALASGINSGQNLSGFSVSFDWLGNGTPASQNFEVYNSDFSSLEFGKTTLLRNLPTEVSEPSTLLLFLAGIGLALRQRFLLTHAA